MGVGNAVVIWAVLMLALVFVWLMVAWLVRKLVDIRIGWDTEWAVWIVAAGAVGIAIYSVASTVSWLKSHADQRPIFRSEIADNRVVEEHYVFSDVMRMQEPEHGGLIYFLRDRDDKTLVLYDHQSVMLGVQNKDPLASQFQVKNNLVLVRAPKSRLVISREFSGSILDPGDPIQVTGSPRNWPEQDEICDIPWSDLRGRFAATEGG